MAPPVPKTLAFIEMIYVTDVHEVMLRMLIDFFVTDVIKEMNFFLRRS